MYLKKQLTLLSGISLLTIILFSSNITAADSNTAKSLLGKTSPHFTLSDLAGNKQNLKQWQGKVIFLNFWASWCAPCVKEIPLLNTFQKHYKEDGLQIIGIAIDNTIAIRKFIKKIPIAYPILLGNAQLTLKFGNKIGTLPYSIVINRQGDIVEIASGLLSENYLQNVIEKYL